MKKIIFSDLDGTLLDHTSYSYEKAKNALELVKKKEVPLVFCTSKTRVEIEYWRKKIGNTDPFISENGGAIFIPRRYFNFDFFHNKKNKDYFIIVLGSPYKRLVAALEKLKKKFDILGFHEMSVDQLSKDADLTGQQAAWAKNREFDEPFKILDKTQEEEIFRHITRMNLRLAVGGRYYHLIGLNDKGRAVTLLSDLYRKEFGKIQTIGIGDSENDYPMLDHVEHSYLVKEKNNKYSSSRYLLAGGIGPEGWKKVIDLEVKP
jgi:mannosyl-3-phosphoglycerate phosphatase